MKKTVYVLIASILALMLLSGCSGTNVALSPTDTEATTPEPTPEATEPAEEPAPPPAFEQSNEPFSAYDFPELAGLQLSVNAAGDLFGEPKSAYAFEQAADGVTYLCIEYEGAYIQLTDLPQELAEKGGAVLDDMTGEDKVDDLNVDSIWIRSNSQASGHTVRGAGIGSSREQVLAAFLNLSDKYEEGVLYTIADINPAWGADWTQSFVGGRILSGEDAAEVPVVRGGENGDMDYVLEPIDCDEVIEYTYVNDYEDYPLAGPGQWNTYSSLRFFIKNGFVTDIYLYRFTDPE